MKVKVSVGLFIFFIGLIIGVQWHRLFIFPFPQLRDWKSSQFHTWQLEDENIGQSFVELSDQLTISIYSKNTPVFLDRLYFDSIGDNHLEGLYLVQIPRHYDDNIRIKPSKDLIIYRAISDNNNNLHYYRNDWDSAGIQINIKGSSTSHTKLIKKTFSANGLIDLNSGGPVSSDPIFIMIKDYVTPPLRFEILN